MVEADQLFHGQDAIELQSRCTTDWFCCPLLYGKHTGCSMFIFEKEPYDHINERDSKGTAADRVSNGLSTIESSRKNAVSNPVVRITMSPKITMPEPVFDRSCLAGSRSPQNNVRYMCRKRRAQVNGRRFETSCLHLRVLDISKFDCKSPTAGLMRSMSTQTVFQPKWTYYAKTIEDFRFGGAHDYIMRSGFINCRVILETHLPRTTSNISISTIRDCATQCR